MIFYFLFGHFDTLGLALDVLFLDLIDLFASLIILKEKAILQFFSLPY